MSHRNTRYHPNNSKRRNQKRIISTYLFASVSAEKTLEQVNQGTRVEVASGHLRSQRIASITYRLPVTFPVFNPEPNLIPFHSSGNGCSGRKGWRSITKSTALASCFRSTEEINLASPRPESDTGEESRRTSCFSPILSSSSFLSSHCVCVSLSLSSQDAAPGAVHFTCLPLLLSSTREII